jgi:hypothetical protein
MTENLGGRLGEWSQRFDHLSGFSGPGADDNNADLVAHLMDEHGIYPVDCNGLSLGGLRTLHVHLHPEGHAVVHNVARPVYASSRTLIERTHYILVRVIEDERNAPGRVNLALTAPAQPYGVMTAFSSRSWHGDQAGDEEGEDSTADYAKLADIMNRRDGTASSAEMRARHQRELLELEAQQAAERKDAGLT